MISMLHQGLEFNARQIPGKWAYRFRDAGITYQQLNLKSNGLAHLLLRLGAHKGDRVGVLMNQCLESIESIFGILKAGACAVPLDPFLPEERLASLILDCQIKYLIASPEHLGKVLKSTSDALPVEHIIVTDSPQQSDLFPSSQGVHFTNWEEIELYEDPPEVQVGPQDLAYIIYTSGSTGLPKGVTHTHASGLSYAKAAADLYQLSVDDVISGHSPFHFDISTFGLYASPLRGACTVIIPHEYKLFPASLSELIQKERMTIWYSVTTALTELILHGDLENRDLSTLRWIKYGGEIFPRKHLERLRELIPQAAICNVYGPAEVNQCSYFHIQPGENLPLSDDVPLGRIWDIAEHLIINQQGEIAQNGDSGELLISAPTAMMGYWNRPHLTEKAFFNHKTEGNNRMFYRTGDLVRYDAQGRLRFLGRKDRQVKWRGYRIELDELEAIFNSLEAVEEAAVFTVERQSGRRIEAAVKLKANVSQTPGKVLAEAAKSLPRYALPKHLSIHKQLPRTGSGKIDRLALEKASLKEN